MTASLVPEGFVTIGDMREQITKLDAAGRSDEADQMEAIWAAHVHAREAVLDISEAIWCEQEGWWEIEDLQVCEPGSSTLEQVVRHAIWHPPTHGGWVMVPREATLAMSDAIFEVMNEELGPMEAYRAAIAAAPLPGGV